MLSDVNIEKLSELIKTCGASNVSHLKFGELEVTFSSSHCDQQTTASQSATLGTLADESTEQIAIKDEVDANQELLAMAILEDPAMYEKLLMSGDLENETANDR